MSIYNNYLKIIDEIKKTASESGHDPNRIKIVTVSKTFPAEIIQKAIDSGIALFGENKIQEAKTKMPELNGNFKFHMIGHLQSNKAKDAVQLFDVIHSIDKLTTAQKVNQEAEKIQKNQKILIQVNTSGEESKSGASPDQILTIVNEIAKFKNINILGLMSIAPLTNDTGRIRNSFRETRLILDKINYSTGLDLQELSMGMSSDFRIAVEEGSTMVRVGSAIFGKRTYT